MVSVRKSDQVVVIHYGQAPVTQRPAPHSGWTCSRYRVVEGGTLGALLCLSYSPRRLLQRSGRVKEETRLLHHPAAVAAAATEGSR